MITIIFIAEDGEPVSIRFSKSEALNGSVEYGRWHVNTNNVELNELGWEFFQKNRKEIRKLKPLLDKLEKVPKNIS